MIADFILNITDESLAVESRRDSIFVIEIPLPYYDAEGIECLKTNAKPFLKCFYAEMNCFKNRTSFSENRRRSLMLYLSIAMRSMPIPKAKPEYFFESILQFSRTFGSTIPQPRISSQPVYLHTLHPLPPQMLHDTSISAEGS